MKKRIIAALAVLCLAVAAGAYAAAKEFHVMPGQYDPGKSSLVQAAWLKGIGCPTSQNYSDYFTGTTNYMDTGCPTGDAKDKKNTGLVLVKTGPTFNNAAAVADIKDVKGMTLTELGYDIRTGSHCGAGAPRFDITTTAGSYFLGCSSPPPTSTPAASPGWKRLRWGSGGTVMAYNASTYNLEPVAGTLKSLQIVFDEAQDAAGGGDGIGSAILDNIDVNGTLTGRGDTDAD